MERHIFCADKRLCEYPRMKRILSFCLLCVYVLAGNAQPRFGTMPQGAPPVPAPRPAFVPPPVAAPSFGSNSWSSPPPVAAPVQNWAPPQNGAPHIAAPVFGGQGNNLPQAQQMVACHSGGFQTSIPLCQAQDARVFGGGGAAPALQAPTTGASPQQFPVQPQLAAPQLQGAQNTAPNLPPPIQGMPQGIKPPMVVAPTQNTIFPQVVPPTLAAPNTQPSSPLAAPLIQQAPQVRSPAQPGFPKVLPESLPQTIAMPSAQTSQRSNHQVQQAQNPYLIAQPKQSQTAIGNLETAKPETYTVYLPIYREVKTLLGTRLDYVGDEKRIVNSVGERDVLRQEAERRSQAAAASGNTIENKANIAGNIVDKAQYVPLIGTGYGLAQSTLGVDANGNKLSTGERIVGAALSAIPDGTLAAGAAKVGEKVIANQIAHDLINNGSKSLSKNLEIDANKFATQSLQESTGILGNVEQIAPARRPTWRQSEKDVLAEKGDTYQPQVSYKNRQEVRYGTDGSVRIDACNKTTCAIEVKNYNIANQAALINKIAEQVTERAVHLPLGMSQEVILDFRGQTITPQQIIEIRKGIIEKSQNKITPELINFLIN